MGEVCHAARSVTLRDVSPSDDPSTAKSAAPIALGPTLELGWQLFKRGLPRCLPLALLAVLIGQLPAVYLLSMADRGAVWLLLNALAAIAGLALWLLIMQRQYALLHGQMSTLGGDLVQVLGALPCAVGVLVVTVLLIGVGSLLLVVPGVYFLVALWPALTLAVCERRCVREAVDGSLQLVRGRWSTAAGVWVITLIAVFGVVILGMGAGLLLIEWQLVTGMSVGTLVSALVPGLVGALFPPLVIAFGLALHARLRQSAQPASSASNSA
jgi:hypothetical protein